MPTPRRSLAVHSLLVLALGGCAGLPFSPDDEVCTEELRWGLVVNVRDADSGEPAGGGAVVRAQSGDYVEVLRAFPVNAGETLMFHGLDERPGTYDVTVAREGYASWRADDVRLLHDGCHVVTVHLDAHLVPQD